MATTSLPEVHDGGKTPIVTEKDDIGLQFIAQHGWTTYTPEEERKVKWKLDLHMMPILMITYMLQYLDKVTLGYAAVYTLRTDLHLVGQQYSWCSSMFYFGYLVGQIPANYLLQRFPIGKFAATNLLIWGALVMLCSVSHSFAGLATIRFLMGFFESGISPAWTHITSMFYTKGEQGARCTTWFAMNGVGTIIGGFLSYGMGHTHSAVHQWQLVFLLCGAITIAWAVVVFFFLPDSPTSAKFLTEREKSIAVERLRDNRTGVKNTVFKVSQAIEAFKDPQVWIFAVGLGVSSIGNVGGSFLPIIIKDLGFSGLQSTLLNIPSGGFEIVSMIIAGLASSLFGGKGRTLIMFAITAPTLVGCIFLAALPRSDKWVRIVGAWLLLCTPAATALQLSLIGSNVAGFSKKVTTTAYTFILYCVGNIISPQLFKSNEAPGYGTAMRTLVASTSTMMFLYLMLFFYYKYENNRRDKILAQTSQDVIDATTVENEEYFDRTDMEDFLKFRYAW
ncbi:hypothetical protein B7463_g7719, partial [Scytalidium lignicola]